MTEPFACRTLSKSQKRDIQARIKSDTGTMTHGKDGSPDHSRNESENRGNYGNKQSNGPIDWNISKVPSDDDLEVPHQYCHVHIEPLQAFSEPLPCPTAAEEVIDAHVPQVSDIDSKSAGLPSSCQSGQQLAEAPEKWEWQNWAVVGKMVKWHTTTVELLLGMVLDAGCSGVWSRCRLL